MIFPFLSGRIDLQSINKAMDIFGLPADVFYYKIYVWLDFIDLLVLKLVSHETRKIVQSIVLKYRISLKPPSLPGVISFILTLSNGSIARYVSLIRPRLGTQIPYLFNVMNPYIHRNVEDLHNYHVLVFWYNPTNENIIVKHISITYVNGAGLIVNYDNRTKGCFIRLEHIDQLQARIIESIQKKE